jgi:hypothetical protein
MITMPKHSQGSPGVACFPGLKSGAGRPCFPSSAKLVIHSPPLLPPVKTARVRSLGISDFQYDPDLPR